MNLSGAWDRRWTTETTSASPDVPRAFVTPYRRGLQENEALAGKLLMLLLLQCTRQTVRGEVAYSAPCQLCACSSVYTGVRTSLAVLQA